MSMLPLTADQALKPKTRREALVQLPDFDAPLRLLQPSADSTLKLRALSTRMRKDDPTAETEFSELLLRSSCVDGAGQPLFNEKTVKIFLTRLSPEGLECALVEAQKLLKKETPEGNSEGSPSEG